MRKITGLLLISAAVFVVFNSCKKDYANEQSTPIVNPTLPDLGVKITASVSGFITDENNEAVQGAQVTGGTQTVTTNQFGYFKISNTSLSKTAGFVKVTMSGYFNGYRTFVANEGKETFIRLKLIRKINTGTINSATGGTVTTSDGSSVTLPADAVVNAANNIAYTGTINVAAHLIDPTANDISLVIPGNLYGLDTSEYLKVLNSYGMLAVELTDASGNLLQIASGKQATLSFSIPSTLTSSAPATIPLWFLDETSGLWKEEKAATKTGSNYVGNVSHFSFWNCDIPNSIVHFSAQFVDDSLHALANVPVSISIEGNLNSGMVAYTDTSGYVDGFVPANTNLTLNVLTQCNTSFYSKDFTTGDNDIDWGTIIVNTGQLRSTITGKATDCNNAKISTGIVIITDTTGFNNAVYINNGVFNLYNFYCSNTTVSIVAIDFSNNQLSSPLSLKVIQGRNDIGTLSVCSGSSDEFLVYSIDGDPPKSFTPEGGNNSAVYHPNSYGTHTGPSTQIEIHAKNNLAWFVCVFDGNPAIRSYIINTAIHLTDTSPIGLQDGYENDHPLTINITEYGSVNEYISGNLSDSLTVNSQQLTGRHLVTLSFRVKRTQ